jgi:hypothetical protein
MLVVGRPVQGLEVIPIERNVGAEIFDFLHRIPDDGVLGVLLLELDADAHGARSHVSRQ